jgi:homoserine dehydrogenase
MRPRHKRGRSYFSKLSHLTKRLEIVKPLVNIALAGCGTVGSAVAKQLILQRDRIEQRTGVKYDLRVIAVADASKERSAVLSSSTFTANTLEAIDDPYIDVVIECIGGTGEAAEVVERALDHGRHVVTANKDLIATQGPRLHALAISRGVSLQYEGAVGGAIPLVRILNDAVAGDDVLAFSGVLNGTCTSILSGMEDGSDFTQALANARRLGYAEADPSNDIDGTDAAHKLAIVIQRAFQSAVLSPRLVRRGIAGVTAEHVVEARRRGLCLRLVAAAVKTSDGIAAEVAPVAVPRPHSFAKTAGAQNAARIYLRSAELLEFGGAGAGGEATASAVLSDVVAVLRAIAERNDVRKHAHRCQLGAVAQVSPLFGALEPSGVWEYPLWSDDRIAREATPREVACA